MAYKIQLRLAGGMFSVGVTAKQAVEKEDSDTKLVTLCCGKGDSTPPGKVSLIKHGVHAPVRPKQTVTCPICKTKRDSWTGWEKGKDNEDGTFTPVPRTVLESAKPGEHLTKLIDLTLHPLDEVESQTLPSGRMYYLEPGKEAAATYNAVVSVVRRLQAKGKAFVTRYAVVSAVSQYRLIVIDGVLAFQELAVGAQIRLRPQINFPEADSRQVDLLEMASEMTFAPFDPALYPDEHAAIVAKALAEATASPGGVAATPVVAAPRASDPFAALEAMLAAGTKVPHQPLPSEVPGNVSTALLDGTAEKPAPKKRAPRKKAAEKVSA